MTGDAISISVISPERLLFEGTAKAVVVPAHDGEIGILSGHAPLMTLLGRGMLRVAGAGGEVRFEIVGGFLQVVDNQVRIVAEHATPA